VLLAACGGGGASQTAATPSTPDTAAPVTPGDPAVASTPAPTPTSPEDPYLWLEDVTAEKSLAWARDLNAKSAAELEAVPGFEETRARILSILDSKDKIPYVVKSGKWLYNLWTDAEHPRGLYRRTTLAEYRKKSPKWETVLDIDALGAAEGESWVFEDIDCMYPKFERCLVSLSRGGADAKVVREFDVIKKQFVQDGFTLPEAKSIVSWKDLDTIYVGTDFGPGSMTSSGYPRIAKEWTRGTPLTEAKTIFEGEPNDMAAEVVRHWDHGKPTDLAIRQVTFYSLEVHLRGAEGFTKVDKPDDALLSFWNDQVMVRLRSDWNVGGKTWPAGSLITAPRADYLAGKRDFVALFTPTEHTSLSGTTELQSIVLVNELEDVHNRLYAWKHGKKGWKRSEVKTPKLAAFGATPFDDDRSDDYWFTTSDFLTPTTLELAHGAKRELMKKSPSYFDSKGLEVTQHFVASKDGTKIPYFQISKKDLKLDGAAPTLLYGYGGFEISLRPSYKASVGAAWLEKGGVYILANLRGGGEYGPAWHQAGLKTKRQVIYDDFAAVAEDLIARQVTSPAKLGIMGGSNGGLLVGVMMTQRPDLFGAVVCSVPLLDMKRYHLLLAGASWMAEYGNPDDPTEWAAIAKYSPYQNVKKGVKYPRVLFTTSTRDDRVHPGHARKMAARMIEQEHDVLYYENIEGGHGGAADNKQLAHLSALEYSFLAKQLGL
jgi:prolyl oligopeptidase